MKHKHEDELEKVIHAPKPTTHGGVHTNDSPGDDGGGPETKPDPPKQPGH